MIDFINYPERIFSVGRLDKNSTGLLLLTNDGALAYQITHPKFGHEKEYLVQVNKPLTADCCHKLANGIKLEEGKTAPAQVKQHSNREFEIILTEGKKRQIRRMCEALGYKVTKLKRTRLLTLKLGALPVGSWRSLSKTQLKSIKQSLEKTKKNSFIKTKARGLASRLLAAPHPKRTQLSQTVTNYSVIA